MKIKETTDHKGRRIIYNPDKVKFWYERITHFYEEENDKTTIGWMVRDTYTHNNTVLYGIVDATKNEVESVITGIQHGGFNKLTKELQPLAVKLIDLINEGEYMTIITNNS